MKFEALQVVCRWPWQILGDIRTEARARQKIFCLVNNAWLPISDLPNFTKFAHKTCICEMGNLSEHNFENLSAGGLFFKKTNSG